MVTSNHRSTRVALTATAFIGLVVALAAAGCGGDADPPAAAPTTGAPAGSPTPSATPERPGPGDHSLSLNHDGQARTYLVHAPPSYTSGSKLPLVVVLHFRPGDGDAMKRMTGLDAKADKENFLVAYADGISGSYNALVCCGTTDDVGFVKALVTHLGQDWGADPARTYATGISNGGDLTYRLAVEAPGMFAAIAPVSGGFIGDKAATATFKPAQPVSVLTIIGGQDRFAADFTAGVAAWQQRLGCRQTASGPFGTSGRVARVATACADGSEVVAYTVEGMGHSWPGGVQATLAAPDAPINATDLLWDFFKAHPRR